MKNKPLSFVQDNGNKVVVNPTHVGAVIVGNGESFAFLQGRRLRLSEAEASKLAAAMTANPRKRNRKPIPVATELTAPVMASAFGRSTGLRKVTPNRPRKAVK